MSNVEKLKEYLIGENGYLLNDISNGKVIMLSGEWGSGKTHFWKNEIEPEFKKKPYAYVSLYGKTSIASIENDLYMQIYSSTNNEGDFISKASSTLISTYAKVFKPLSIIDAVESEKLVVESKHKKAIESLQQNALICFDDFERKSKDVDLNDLFGFITQLALNFNCKIVLILNSDVFEGKEKEIFTNIKEKTVSKYLKFAPTCDELFELIIQDEKYAILRDDNEIEKTLKDTFDEVGMVNARILIQVLDNLSEWHSKQMDCSPFFIRYFVLVNINFILNHHVLQTFLYNALKGSEKDKNSLISYILSDDTHVEFLTNSTVKSNIDFMLIVPKMLKKFEYDTKILENFKKEILLAEKSAGKQRPDNGEIILKFIEENQSLVKSLLFLICFGLYKYSQSDNQSEVDDLNKINNFIETGIL